MVWRVLCRSEQVFPQLRWTLDVFFSGGGAILGQYSREGMLCLTDVRWGRWAVAMRYAQTSARHLLGFFNCGAVTAILANHPKWGCLAGQTCAGDAGRSWWGTHTWALGTFLVTAEVRRDSRAHMRTLTYLLVFLTNNTNIYDSRNSFVRKTLNYSTLWNWNTTKTEERQHIEHRYFFIAFIYCHRRNSFNIHCFDRSSIFSLNGRSLFFGRDGGDDDFVVGLVSLISSDGAWYTLSAIFTSTTSCGELRCLRRVCDTGPKVIKH